jgi:hypothetical protein
MNVLGTGSLTLHAPVSEPQIGDGEWRWVVQLPSRMPGSQVGGFSLG